MSLLSAEQQAAALEQAGRPATITAGNNSATPQAALLQRLPAVQTRPYQLLSPPGAAAGGAAGRRSPRGGSRRLDSKKGRAADAHEDDDDDAGSISGASDAESGDGDAAGRGRSSRRSGSKSQVQHAAGSGSAGTAGTAAAAGAAHGATSFWGVTDARAAAATAAAAAVSTCGRPAARWGEELQVAVGLAQLVQQDALMLVELLQPPRWVRQVLGSCRVRLCAL
jgi:hypothetical protein